MDDLLREGRDLLREKRHVRKREYLHALAIRGIDEFVRVMKKMPERVTVAWEERRIILDLAEYQFEVTQEGLMLQGTCPICNKPALSLPIRNVADLAEMVDNFIARHEH